MSDNRRQRFKILVMTGLLALLLIIVISSWRRHEDVGRLPAQVRGESPVRRVQSPVGRAQPPTPKVASVGVDPMVSICGLGKVPFDANDPSAAGRFIDDLTRSARNRWLAALLNSGDIRARSVGLFLKGKLASRGFGSTSDEQSRDALVQIAVGARDPAIYAMAVYACNTYSESIPTGSCQQITLETWANLDSQNAVPWLLLAGRARANKDPATEATAFSRAAKANRTDDFGFSLYAYAELEMPNDLTPLERWSASIALVGIEAATPSWQYHEIGQYCSAAVISDDGVRRQCDALAELLVSRGTNLLDFGLGANVGARAGWSQDRVTRLKEERDALLQAIMQATPSSHDDLWTCEAVHRGNAYMAEWARLGEMGAAREAVDQSGQSLSDLAQKHRDFLDKVFRDAQQREQAAPAVPVN